MAKWIFNFQSRIRQNSGSSNHRFGRQLSQLSDGPLNGSKQLAICKLQQSETRPVTETTILG
jgi:hypothetical protein